MQRLLIILSRALGATVLLLSQLTAQENGTGAEPVPGANRTSDIQELVDRIQQDSYAYSFLETLSNSIGPRLSGSPQADAASRYVAQQMRDLGLKVELQPVSVPHWIRGDGVAELVDYPGQVAGSTQRIDITALGHSRGTPVQGIQAQVFVTRDLTDLAKRKGEVEGKIVLVDFPFDDAMAKQGFPRQAYRQVARYRRESCQTLESYKASAVLIRSIGGAAYRLLHTGASKPCSLPIAAITVEDADLIVSLIKKGPVTMRLRLTCQELPRVQGFNVIGDIPGSEFPEDKVIISGHLDSWDLGTGAIDDGAGVAMIMQVAKSIKDLGIKPKRTIRLIAWMDEEIDQSGAKQYVAQNRADLKHHIAALESDFGADHPVGIQVNAPESFIKPLQASSTVLDQIGAGLVILVHDEVGTDVAELAALGVPTLAPLQDGKRYFDYHHTAADTLDKIDRFELSKNAAVVGASALALAEGSPANGKETQER